jgi:hypothetical protein
VRRHAPPQADETGPLEVSVKESLVKRGDLVASFDVRPIEPDEVTVLRERSGIGLATARVPGIYQSLIEGADGRPVRRWRGWWGRLGVHAAGLLE